MSTYTYAQIYTCIHITSDKYISACSLRTFAHAYEDSYHAYIPTNVHTVSLFILSGLTFAVPGGFSMLAEGNEGSGKTAVGSRILFSNAENFYACIRDPELDDGRLSCIDRALHAKAFRHAFFRRFMHALFLMHIKGGFPAST